MVSGELTRRGLLRASLLGGGVLALAARGGVAAADPRPALDAGAARVLATTRRPWFPARWFRVTDFGAAGDGRTDCTTAFRHAIEACHRAGGGHVLVPPGNYATGAIHLLSNVDLHLEQGSRILFSTDPAAYLPVVYTRWQGIEFMNYSPLVYAFGQRNIAITGAGELDGQADATHWWDWKTPSDQEFAVLEAQANAGVPVPQRVFGPGFHFRPLFVQPYRCDTVLIEGVTFRNSPAWHLNPVLCRNVVVDGVTVASSGPNTDGCDPESCDGVVVTGCSFDTGDDCIAIKAGRNTDGRRVNVPCRDVLIERSSFADGHGGVTIGSEMTGGVRDVYARDLTMNSPNLRSGHRIKTNSVRGGYVENVHLGRITAGTIGGPVLLVDYSYGEGDTGEYPPTVTDINLSEWTVQACEQGWQMAGYPEDPIGRVALTDVTIASMSGTNVAEYVRDLELRRVSIGGRPVTGT
ncbi:polygalacturonase [Amycolatopsis bartoniae]|uniref:glycoside hydrolase family 28 protein n=1 Tax=Amycolatopsis bartoniae TaxID=941986 RepID=UPI0011916B48|nr:glycoside hydrolase family 28 protein [Amycolatopsis bartoniae]MBB2938497.1 polygalacturonase [Amycolatopsis bartoniae]TVT10357.1 glycoside hydrolase family 28 protein [Amycolatopsis bartoniae]